MFCCSFLKFARTIKMNISSEPIPLLKVERILFGYIIPIVTGTGFILNALTIALLSVRRQYFRESCYVYLTNLAIADLLTVFAFCLLSISRSHGRGKHTWAIIEAYIYWPLGSVCSGVSILVTVAVSLERCVFVYFPLKARSVGTRSLGIKICTSIWFFSFIFCFPRFFVFTVKNGFVTKQPFTDNRKFRAYIWIHFLIFTICPTISLIILNLLLVCGVRRATKKYREMTSTRDKEMRNREIYQRKLTKMMIIVVFVFIIGELPSAILSRIFIVEVVKKDENFLKTNLYMVLSSISVLLVSLQHSVNFFIYCTTNKRFWNQLKKMIERSKPVGNHGIHSSKEDPTNSVPRSDD